jgi:RNA polymerase sigma-70 factor (ECF subfamily)
MPAQADDELARAAAARDPDALRTLVERLADRVRRIAWGITSDHHEVHDLCQEGLLKATSTEVLQKYRNEAPLDVYLGRVATRAMISAVRARGKTWLNTAPTETLPESPDGRAPAEVPELDDGVRSAIRALPDRARLVLVLIAIEDMSYQMVADHLGLELGTVKSTYSRARHSIRTSLARAGNHSEDSLRPPGDE